MRDNIYENFILIFRLNVLDYKKANVMNCVDLLLEKIIQWYPLLICKIVASMTLHHGASSPSAWKVSVFKSC